MHTALPFHRLMLPAAGFAWFAFGWNAGPTASAETPQPTIASATAEIPERDRQAILAMAGGYRVGFHFEETIPLVEGYELREDYSSGALEWVEVVSDEPGHIVLQHILVADEDRLVKHWKQEWVWQPEQVLEYAGEDTWKSRDLTAEEREGAWVQMVSQVDDSPRYASVGVWSHEAGVSSWTGKPTLRPLPRRERPRKRAGDYDVLFAVNRHLITPDGWVHEQDNRKRRIDADGPVDLVAERGFNTYLRTDDERLGLARSYWREHRDFWQLVTSQWHELHARHQAFQIRRPDGSGPLYRKMGSLAAEWRSGEVDDVERAISEILEAYVVGTGEDSRLADVRGGSE